MANSELRAWNNMKDYEKKTIEYYNSNAEKYISGTIDADMSNLYGHFLKYLKPGAAVLDLGCGTGRDSKHFIDEGFDVTAVDGSAKMCACAAELTGLKVREVLFEDIDYEQQFDAVWACASLLHLSKLDLPGVIAKVRQSLKPGGVFFACFKYGSGEKECDGRYFSYFDEAGAAELFDEGSGFTVMETFTTGDVREGRGGEAWMNVIARRG